MRSVEVEHGASEVCAVGEQETVIRFVLLFTKVPDECLILRRACFNLEAIELPVIGGADQLRPVAWRRMAIGAVGYQQEQVGAAIIFSSATDSASTEVGIFCNESTAYK